jgi:hypothetical protein
MIYGNTVAFWHRSRRSKGERLHAPHQVPRKAGGSFRGEIPHHRLRAFDLVNSGLYSSTSSSVSEPISQRALSSEDGSSAAPCEGGISSSPAFRPKCGQASTGTRALRCGLPDLHPQPCTTRTMWHLRRGPHLQDGRGTDAAVSLWTTEQT